MRPEEPPRVLVLGCGALVRELAEIVERNGLAGVEVACLPGRLHNIPDRIPSEVRRRLEEAVGRYQRVFVAYADCGTGGRLDRVLAEFGVERLPGSHCYELFAGADSFAAISAEEPGTFYLTDYLARNFEVLVWRGLGLDRHPHLRDAYFGNYRRVVYLSQHPRPALVKQAAAAAERLGLEFEHHPVGLGELEPAVLVGLSPPRVAA